MTYTPGRLRNKSKEITNARNWGIGLITAAFGIGFFLSELQRMRDLQADPLNYAYIVLLLLTGGLIFLWIWATQRELDLLFEWLDPERYVPPSSLKETVLILFCALALVALLYAARDPLVYAVVFTVYSGGSMFAGVYRDSEIKQAIERSLNRLSNDLDDPVMSERTRLYLAAVHTLKSYFIERPMLRRGYICTTASVAGLVIALNWRIHGLPLLGLLAYVLFILLIVISEINIYRWLTVRDLRLRQVEAEVAEILPDSVKARGTDR